MPVALAASVPVGVLGVVPLDADVLVAGAVTVELPAVEAGCVEVPPRNVDVDVDCAEVEAGVAVGALSIPVDGSSRSVRPPQADGARAKARTSGAHHTK